MRFKPFFDIINYAEKHSFATFGNFIRDELTDSIETIIQLQISVLQALLPNRHIAYAYM